MVQVLALAGDKIRQTGGERPVWQLRSETSWAREYAEMVESPAAARRSPPQLGAP